MLPHWLDHGDGHIVEFEKWIDLLRAGGQDELAEDLAQAVASMKESQAHLRRALTKVGGSAAHHGAHEHHGHHHSSE